MKTYTLISKLKTNTLPFFPPNSKSGFEISIDVIIYDERVNILYDYRGYLYQLYS